MSFLLILVRRPGPLLLAIVFVVGTAHLGAANALAGYQASVSSKEDESYNQALQAYSQNRFSEALAKLEQVNGVHAEEAKKYLAKIKAYKEAMQEADTQMTRSPDELDIDNLDFAIQRYQEALKIKPDGPWQPKEKLDRAVALKNDLLQRTKASTDARDRALCDKALIASRNHRFRDAERLSCALSNDNPAYLCKGDEAGHMCEQMRELAASQPDLPPVVHGEGNERQTSPTSQGGAQSTILSNAMTAYEKNDFRQARTLFQSVKESEKSAAGEYLNKIAHYEAAMKQAGEAERNSKYDEARGEYLEAASIKLDGPGSPQQQAWLMDLEQGIDEFYSGKYSEAGEHLDKYARESNKNGDLVHFYAGASKLAKFFLAGGRDDSLREQAINDLRNAKKAGFDAKDRDVSPKILKAYDQLSF